jgi:hypothetical protein
MNLPMLPLDKANHALYGAAAAIIGAALGHMIGLDVRLSGALSASVAGVLKEVADHFLGGDVSAADAIATACGAIPVVVGASIALGW